MKLFVHAWATSQEPLRIWMLWIIENFCDATLLNDFAFIHHDDIIRNVFDHTQIMGDEHHAHIMLLLQIMHEIQNCCLNGHIQCGCWLISNEQSGIA